MTTEARVAAIDAQEAPLAHPISGGRGRFISAVCIGLAAVVVPFLWVLMDLWNGPPSLLRTAEPNGYASNFYDLQARAMFHGHLSIVPGALKGEAFVHDGRQYTYFGLFPSLIRMPILAVTHSLDGRLTAPLMLIAWLLTAIFSAALIWRIRILARGTGELGGVEAAAYGVLVATIMCGSVLVSLASAPWVFSEDLAWSVALTVGTMFALVGVVERPSMGRVVVSGCLILGANLTRGSTGYACVLGAVLVAGWLALGRGESANRRWAPPMMVAGLVPLAIGSAVTYAKFGILFGLPVSAQIVYQAFGLNHFGSGNYFGLHYVPSTLRAYFQPFGLRLSPVFPFVTLPSAPAAAVGGVFLYGTDRTASVPSSMPLLLCGGLWGTVSSFRPQLPGGLSRLRVVLIAAAAAGGTVIIYGWIENRFLADFLPFLILASAVGFVDFWRRLETRNRSVRTIVLAVVTVLGAFGIVANLGMSTTPQAIWSSTQDLHYVEVQKSISDLTGGPLSDNIVRGDSLPIIASADQLFIAGNCAALYISDGNVPADRHPTFPARVVELGTVWYPVELGSAVLHTLDITFHGSAVVPGTGVTLVSVGAGSRSVIAVEPDGAGVVRFRLTDPFGSAVSSPLRVEGSTTYPVKILTDPYRHLASVTWNGDIVLAGVLSSHGRGVVHTVVTGPGQPVLPMTVAETTSSDTDVSLCRRLR